MRPLIGTLASEEAWGAGRFRGLASPLGTLHEAILALSPESETVHTNATSQVAARWQVSPLLRALLTPVEAAC